MARVAAMVIRFDKRTRKGVLPLFERLQELGGTPRHLRLSERQVQHRKRMLQYLATQRRAVQ